MNSKCVCYCSPLLLETLNFLEPSLWKPGSSGSSSEDGVTLEKGSFDLCVLHFSLPNAGDLINLLADVEVERYFPCCISISSSVIMRLNCKSP